MSSFIVISLNIADAADRAAIGGIAELTSSTPKACLTGLSMWQIAPSLVIGNAI